MKNVGPTRVELATRTIFNLLGPLSNPAGVKRQMVGVFSRQWVQPLAQVLKNLGSESVWVVHGSDGLDEITLTGPTFVASARQRQDHHLRGDAGGRRPHALQRRRAEGRRCRCQRGARCERARAASPAPIATSRCLNAAAALIVAGRARDLKEGVALGRQVARQRRGRAPG